MLAALPDLNRRWQEVLGAGTAIGIGINTGLACVGNIGTEYKFKYGPLGDTVNVASRLQGASRYLDSPIVITRATCDRLGGEFLCRGLGRTRVLDIVEPIEVFGVYSPRCKEAAEICARHEQGLGAFQAGDLDGAIRMLRALTSDYPDDGPSASLLARALSFQRAGQPGYDPILTLS
jgi:adenylate cyclase